MIRYFSYAACLLLAFNSKMNLSFAESNSLAYQKVPIQKVRAARPIKLPKKINFPNRDFRSSFPYITGETFRAFSHHVFDPISSVDPKAVQAGDIIFVFDTYLEYFFTNISPLIAHPYIIITHHFFGDSDNSIPGDHLAQYLDTPNLIAWFGINVASPHPKLHLLPIGISTSHYFFGDVETVERAYQKRNTIAKDRLLYLNITLHTFPKERQFVYDLFKNEPYCDSILYDKSNPHTRFRTHSEFLQDLTEHKFVLCPRGNGEDCHRTWETLLMGSYPILKSSVIDPVFEKLPVVIINNWEEVTEAFLEKKYLELKSREDEFDYERLYMPYWLKKIQNVRDEFFKNYFSDSSNQ